MDQLLRVSGENQDIPDIPTILHAETFVSDMRSRVFAMIEDSKKSRMNSSFHEHVKSTMLIDAVTKIKH